MKADAMLIADERIHHLSRFDMFTKDKYYVDQEKVDKISSAETRWAVGIAAKNLGLARMLKDFLNKKLIFETFTRMY